MRTKQPVVAGDQGHAIDLGGCDEESVARILMGRVDKATVHGDFVIEWSLLERNRRADLPNPRDRVRIQENPRLFGQHKDLPCGDRRHPEFVGRMLEFGSHVRREAPRFEQAPEKDVGVQEQFTDGHH